MQPKLSYTIWFTQRTGSTLLCKAIESTGIAGKPREWFNCPPDLLTTFHQSNHAELQEYLWTLGSTPNGSFGINHSFHEPHFSQLTETLRKFPACPPAVTRRTTVWKEVFPNHRPSHLHVSPQQDTACCLVVAGDPVGRMASASGRTPKAS
jgi:LPS sulfotransferase NodH